MQLSTLHVSVLAPSDGHQTYHKMVLTINTNYTFHTYYCGPQQILKYRNTFVQCDFFDSPHFLAHIIICSNLSTRLMILLLFILLWA